MGKKLAKEESETVCRMRRRSHRARDTNSGARGTAEGARQGRLVQAVPRVRKAGEGAGASQSSPLTDVHAAARGEGEEGDDMTGRHGEEK
jgi:hypothetical protein